MRSVVKTGKTVDEAVVAALEALGATLDEVNIEIMEQPKSGFLGMFGSKDAVVRVIRKENEALQNLLQEEGIRSKKGRLDRALETEEDRANRLSQMQNEQQIVETPAPAAPNKSVEVVETKAEAASPVKETEDFAVSVDAPAPDMSEQAEVEQDALDEMPDTPLVSTPIRGARRVHPVTSVERVASAEEVRAEETQVQPAVEAEPVAAKDTSVQNAHAPSIAELIRQQVQQTPAEDNTTAAVSSPEKELEMSAEASDPALSVEKKPAEVSIQDTEDALAFAKQWMHQTLVQMHLQADVEAHADGDDLYLELTNITDTDMGIVIGRRAETLNAIQYLLGVTMNRTSRHHYRVYLDVGGYRKRRAQNITRLAERSAEKVVRFKKTMKMEPMNAYERRIVHTALQGKEHIETVSEGREPHRKVVILYKD